MTQKMKTWLVGSIMLVFLYLFLIFGVLALNTGQLNATVDSGISNGILIAGADSGGFDGG